MSLISELKRRNVFRVAVAYAVVAWLLIEVSATLLPAFEAPDWILRVVVLLLGVGFVVSLFISWAYELTPDGLKPTHEVDQSDSITHATGQKINYIIIGVLVLAVGFMFVDNYVLDEAQPVAVVATPPAPVIEPATLEPVPEAEEPTREVLPNSVAVLPFDNLSPDPDNAYFAAGVHEDILNQLAKINDLSVISRTSVLRYAEDRPPIPEIAEALNVQAVLEGSVRFADDQVRVQAQLIDGVTDEHIWAEVFQRDLADVFAIQSEIAEQIAAALEAELSPAEQASIDKPLTSSPEALRYYTQALQRNLSTALRLEYLDRAIELDPEFSRAYARRAYTLANRGGFSSRTVEERIEDERLAIQDAERALELDPQLGYAWVAIARVHGANKRVPEALEALTRATELSPNDTEVLDVHGSYLANIEEFEASINVLMRAVALDPVNAELHDAVGDTYFAASELDKAAEAYIRSRDLDPGQPGAERRLGVIEAMRGNEEAAVEHFRRAAAFGRGSGGEVAYAYHLLGRNNEAQQMANDLLGEADEDSSIGLALLYLSIGDEAAALQNLNAYADSNYTTGWAHMFASLLQNNIFNDPVLDKPEFVEVRQRLVNLDRNP